MEDFEPVVLFDEDFIIECDERIGLSSSNIVIVEREEEVMEIDPHEDAADVVEEATPTVDVIDPGTEAAGVSSDFDVADDVVDAIHDPETAAEASSSSQSLSRVQTRLQTLEGDNFAVMGAQIMAMDAKDVSKELIVHGLTKLSLLLEKVMKQFRDVSELGFTILSISAQTHNEPLCEAFKSFKKDGFELTKTLTDIDLALKEAHDHVNDSIHDAIRSTLLFDHVFDTLNEARKTMVRLLKLVITHLSKFPGVEYIKMRLFPLVSQGSQDGGSVPVRIGKKRSVAGCSFDEDTEEDHAGTSKRQRMESVMNMNLVLRRCDSPSFSAPPSKTVAGASPLEMLPPELKEKIFLDLTVHNLSSLKMVSKTMNSSVENFASCFPLFSMDSYPWALSSPGGALKSLYDKWQKEKKKKQLRHVVDDDISLSTNKSRLFVFGKVHMFHSERKRQGAKIKASVKNRQLFMEQVRDMVTSDVLRFIVKHYRENVVFKHLTLLDVVIETANLWPFIANLESLQIPLSQFQKLNQVVASLRQERLNREKKGDGSSLKWSDLNVFFPKLATLKITAPFLSMVDKLDILKFCRDRCPKVEVVRTVSRSSNADFFEKMFTFRSRQNWDAHLFFRDFTRDSRAIREKDDLFLERLSVVNTDMKHAADIGDGALENAKNVEYLNLWREWTESEVVVVV